MTVKQDGQTISFSSGVFSYFPQPLLKWFGVNQLSFPAFILPSGCTKLIISSNPDCSPTDKSCDMEDVAFPLWGLSLYFTSSLIALVAKQNPVWPSFRFARAQKGFHPICLPSQWLLDGVVGVFEIKHLIFGSDLMRPTPRPHKKRMLLASLLFIVFFILLSLGVRFSISFSSL